ncbi:uncharacterized protein LOC143781790 [Ranitomeya variabilis]|uniref:uncharacterized protein LOC143781790 n=1 Tax=Ranitomeya variabilis TaxID=490064 RepID=UPI004056BAB4
MLFSSKFSLIRSYTHCSSSKSRLKLYNSSRFSHRQSSSRFSHQPFSSNIKIRHSPYSSSKFKYNPHNSSKYRPKLRSIMCNHKSNSSTASDYLKNNPTAISESTAIAAAATNASMKQQQLQQDTVPATANSAAAATSCASTAANAADSSITNSTAIDAAAGPGSAGDPFSGSTPSPTSSVAKTQPTAVATIPPTAAPPTFTAGQMQNQTQQQLRQIQHVPPQTPSHQPPQSQQLHGHDPSLNIPEDYFFMGCVFAIADYPEQTENPNALWYY